MDLIRKMLNNMELHYCCFRFPNPFILRSGCGNCRRIFRNKNGHTGKGPIQNSSGG